MSRQTVHFTIAAAAVLSMTVSAAPVVAQDMLTEPTSRSVRYDDLDLSNARGRERLETRVRTAANAACGFWATRGIAEKQAADRCRAAALEKAQPKVAEAVRKAAARYAGRTGP